MTDLRKAAEMALTALDALYVNDYSGYKISKHESHVVDEAIQALRQALAMQVTTQDTTQVAKRKTLDELLDSTPECEVVAVSENGIRTLMQALRCTAPVGEHEPIGFFSINDYGNWEENESGYGTPLYTAPPKKEWVGLTKDEVDSWELPDCPTVFEFAQFIEAKLKEKNA